MPHISRRIVHLVIHPISLLLTLAYLNGQSQPVHGYSESAVAQGLSATFVPAAIMAALSAWEAGRLRRADVASWSRRRSWVSVAARAMLPGLPIELTIAIIGPIMYLITDGSAVPSWRALTLVTSSLLVVTGAGWLGFGFGSVLPIVIAPPLALVGCYAWMVLPYGFEPLWLRHLSGSPSGCCMSIVEVDPGAAIAPGIVGIAFIASGLVLAEGHARSAGRGDRLAPRLSAMAALALFAAGSVTAALLVDNLGPDPVRPRTSGLDCADAGTPRICMWTEDASLRHTVATTAESFRNKLGPTGVVLPTTLTEQEPPPRGSWAFSVTPPADANQVAASLAVGLIPQSYECDPLLDSGHDYGIPDVLFAWIMITTDRPITDVNGSSGAVDAAKAAAAQPLTQQGAWFDQQRADLANCTPGSNR